jgi:hypothetical protein
MGGFQDLGESSYPPLCEVITFGLGSQQADTCGAIAVEVENPADAHLREPPLQGGDTSIAVAEFLDQVHGALAPLRLFFFIVGKLKP